LKTKQDPVLVMITRRGAWSTFSDVESGVTIHMMLFMMYVRNTRTFHKIAMTKVCGEGKSKRDGGADRYSFQEGKCSSVHLLISWTHSFHYPNLYLSIHAYQARQEVKKPRIESKE
jgi:hypothetical protein